MMRPMPKKQRVTMAFPHGNMDVSRYLSEFVGDQSYLTFSTTCKGWRQCGNNATKRTRVPTKDTTEGFLKQRFDVGFVRTSTVCQELESMNRLDLVEYAVQRGCPMRSPTYEGAAGCNSTDIMEFAHKEAFRGQSRQGTSWRRTVTSMPSNGRFKHRESYSGV